SGMMDEATRHNFNLLLLTTQRLQTAEEMVTQCRTRGLGGAVISGLRIDEPFLNDLVATNFPIALIDVPLAGPRATFVSVDNVLGASKAVDHLAALGHQSIGFINGHGAAWVSQKRLAGYTQGMRQNGLSLQQIHMFEGDFSKESGRRGAETLLKANPGITAIFAASDLMAVGVLEQLQTMGVDVPNQVSVVGFDDQDFSTHVTPALTTIRQDVYTFGRVASRELIAMVQDEDYVPTHEDLPTVLVPRASSGPVRTSSL
ncbi:MAG: substrate-binding domain-containing protein, partial [Limnochordia bacterium]|nr:substrate-binding domain-containing protein [Limnochordia bacterium]